MANTSSIDRDLNFSQEEVIDGNPKVKTHNIDMGKYGPLSYRELQKLSGIKEDGPTNLSEDELKELDNLSANLGAGDISFSDVEEYDIQSPLMAQGSYWGESMFDPEGTLSPEGLENISDIRANNQPGIVKLAAGLGKMGVLAVTTAVDGILGTVAGIVNMAANASNINSLSEAGEYFVRNPLSEGLQAINEASESWMPNYYTMNELQNDENGEWYKNVFTANFWGDKFIKNVGFTLGAAASAILTSGAASKVFVNKGLREAFKGTVYKAVKEGGERVALSNADDVYKAMRSGEKLFTKSGEVIEEGSKLMKDLQKSAEQLKRAEWGLKLAGSVNSAMGEGRIEAIGAVKELQEKEYNNINEWANNALDNLRTQMFTENSNWFQLVNTGTADNPKWENQLTPEGQSEFERRSKYINDKKNALLYEASMKSSDIANYVFLSNVALLSFSNFVQFGRAMSGGFTTANNFKNLIKGVTKQEARKEGSKEVLKETTKRLGEEGVEAAVNKGAIRRKIARAAANPFMEGFEEISQASIATGAGLQIGSELNQYAKEYNTGLMYDSLYADSIDSDAQETAVGYLNSLLDGAAKTYGKSQSWEEFSIGFLTGMLGIPKVGRKANGKKGLQMSGELWEGIRDAKQMKQEAQELANAINARINTPEMKEYYKGLIRHTKGEKDKLDFLMKDDKFNYENSEFKQLISDALMFDKAGRLEDFYEMIEDYSQLTGDENESLQTIITNSKYTETDANGNPVLNADGKPIEHSMYDGYSIDDMNKELKKRAEKAKKAVDFYVKNSNSLKALYGDNIDKQTLEEMVYNLSQLDNWTDRSREMMSEISRALHSDFRTVREAGVNVEDIDEDLLKSMDDIREFFGKGDKNIINHLLRAIRQGKLSKDNFAKAYEEIQKLKSHKKAVIDTARAKLNTVDTETVNNIERTLKSIETDSKVKETILNDILSLAKTPKDKIDLFNMDINLVQDFNEIIKEAIDTLGTRKVAEKIVEWKNFLNKTIVTAKSSQRKNGNGRILSVQEAIDNLYKSLYSGTEEEEQAFKEKIKKELNEKGKEKKNAIKERTLKSMKTLNDIIKDINKKIKDINSINYLKYKKMLDDLVLIQAAREVTLDKLKNLSEHPEWYTEASQKYLKEMQEKVNEQTSNLLKEKLNTCKTIQDIRALFEDNDISNFNKQRELLEIALKDADEDLRNLINEYLKVKKFKTVMMSVDSGTNEANAEESSNVILRVLDIIDTSQTLKEIFDRLEIGAFTKGMSKEEKEYAQGFLEKVFTAYNASETTKKDKKEETSTEESGEKKSGSRLSRMVKEDAKTWEEGGSTSQKPSQSSNTPSDNSPDDSSKAGAEAEETPADDDTMDEQSIKEYLEKLAGMEPDKKINSLKRKSIKKLEEIKKEADESTTKLIDAIIDSKPTEEYPNYTNNANAIEGKSMHYPENNTTGIVDKEKNNLEETVASSASRPVFDNWTYTIYNIYAAKRSLLQKLSIADEETRKKAEKYVSFMREYNAFRYINDGFLGLKYLKAKREGKEIPIHFIQIADDRNSYTKGNKNNSDSKYQNEKHYTILQCVTLTEAEVKELKDAWGEVKVIKNEYTVKGKKVVEYYQVVGSLHYSNNNFAAANLKKNDSAAYKKYSDLRNASISNDEKIASIQAELANPDTQKNKTLVEALNKEIQIIEMSDRWFAINSSFEGIRKGAIKKNEVDSNISIVEGVNDENKVANSMGTENSGPYIIKNSRIQSAIKTVYGGRLVKGTLASHLNPNDANDIKQAEWQPETNLKDIPVDESGTKLNGNTLLLGFYYGDGGLKIPQASAEDEVVPLRNNNHWAIASTGANGKLFNTAGSVWLMVRTADGKLYPKGLSVRRFNEKEYPKSKYFRKDVSNPSTIMDIIYANAKVMVDPNASQTDKARAKVTISNLIYIPQKYSFGFNNDGKTVYISNKNGGYSRNIEIDVEAIKNADEESKYALINDYAEQLVDALHDEQFSFRFQVSPSKVKKDGDGTYRQLLLDSDVFITNLPILENIGGSFDTYPIDHNEKGWKIVRTEPKPENPNTSPSAPKSSSSMSNNVGIQYGETTFLVKEQDDTLLIIPNNAAKSSGKIQATPEEECAVRLMYNLNKGIISGEAVPGSGIYAMEGSDGKNYFFEVDESNKLHVKSRKGTMEEIQEMANTKLQALNKNVPPVTAAQMEEYRNSSNPQGSSNMGRKEEEERDTQSIRDFFGDEMYKKDSSTQPQQPVSEVPKSEETKTETSTEKNNTSSSFNRLIRQGEETAKIQKPKGQSREFILSILDKAAQDKGYENYRELYNANKDTHPTLVSPDEEFSNPKELKKYIKGECIPVAPF